ncbi:hypothetical protein N6H05_13070 [Sphingobium sp. WTD-1]|uniref:hypothetical protein n=1 Tax=Sphingobium sp. WTD-1 TaxID=2979467 RepID=UPI0024DEBB6B|nr:hypothetical protein [Sphingobium sp. WTD-1]WIA54006.1 hypothetical protein N6H05_13070 [Sphingobium sp. WTD-1]
MMSSFDGLRPFAEGQPRGHKAVMQKYSRYVTLVLIALLLAAGLIIARLYPLANATTIQPGDEPLVSNAMHDAQKLFRSEAINKASRLAVVIRMSDRTCVELRPYSKLPAGTYLACYDNRDGHLIEEKATGGY